ncbi:hypothetical protein [Olsenella uli]|nr:hypothetical protein [Olsenella uli]
MADESEILDEGVTPEMMRAQDARDVPDVEAPEAREGDGADVQ